MKKIFYIMMFLPIMLLAKMEIGSIKINRLENPDSVPLTGNTISWKTQSDKNAVTQKSYQIVLIDDSGKKVFDSGIVESDEQLQVPLKASLQEAKKYSLHLKVVNNFGEKAEKKISFISGIEDWKNAEWIRAPKELRCPIFSANMETKGKIKSAYAFVCGLGLHEFLVNDKKVGDKVLEPAQTNYEQYAYYTTYDLTNLLKKGSNNFKIWLGEGFYRQDVVWGGGLTYSIPLTKATIIVTYENGKQDVLVTNIDDWKYSASPISSANYHEGETYNANLENVFDWKTPEIATGKDIPAKLIPSPMEPMRIVKSLPIQKIWKGENGYIIDIGQLVVGWVEINVENAKDKKFVLRFTEALNKEKTKLDFRSTGIQATTLEQKHIYISNGKEKQVWSPRYVYHSFRYIELEGFDFEPDKNFLTAKVIHTDFKEAGEFECSNDNMNMLHNLALWSMRGNSQGITTDCPAREKSGWLGDAHATIRAHSNNFDAQAFWKKFTDDMFSSANIKTKTFRNLYWDNRPEFDKPEGFPLMCAPGRRHCGAASYDWGTALVQLPYSMYLYYGDKNILEEYYDNMVWWNDFVSDEIKEDGCLEGGLGDWCATFPGTSNRDLISNMFYYSELKILSEVAEILGKKDDVEKFNSRATKTKEAIIKKFYDTEKKFYKRVNEPEYANHTECSLALELGLIPDGDEQAVSDNIVKSSKEKTWNFVNVGCFGIERIFTQLAKYGNKEHAFKVLDKKGTHSFEWMWKYYDATTLWETLPVYGEHDRGDGSWNHVFQCGFDRFFYEDIVGIAPMSEFPGFKKILFAPKMFEFLDYAKSTKETPYGLVTSSWKNSNNSITWEISIPSNSSGKIVLQNIDNLKINGKKPKVLTKNSNTIFELPSGKYAITFDLVFSTSTQLVIFQ